MSDESSLPPVPTQGRLAGIDFGTVRIGVALCDPSQTWVNPWEIYTRKTPQLDKAFFQQLAREERLVGFVIGLPVHASGAESQKSQEARRFGSWLSEGTGLPIAYYDERYSSAEAEHLMSEAGFTKKGRKERIDKLAAQIILSSYLQSGRTSSAPMPLDDNPAS